MGYGAEQKVLKRIGTMARKHVENFNILGYQRYADLNYFRIPSHPSQNDGHQGYR